MNSAANVFNDRDRSRKAFGLDAQTPNEIIREEIDKIFDQFDPQLRQVGFTGRTFRRFAFDKMKADYDRNFTEQSSLTQSFFDQFLGQTDEIVRKGHINALEGSLAPEARVQVLKQFSWRIELGPASGIILPDCVAIGASAETNYWPLTVMDRLELETVLMPLSHDRLLLGERVGATHSVPQTMNEISAACSWDCFIARDRTSESEKLVPRIGERTQELIDETVQEAFEKKGWR